jgi:hypothetical protein
MAILHTRAEEIVQFWNFWLWQYTSRNLEYIKAYNQYINIKMPNEIKKKATEIFQYKFSEETLKILLNVTKENRPSSIIWNAALLLVGNGSLQTAFHSSPLIKTWL